jgi:putative flippase GtrA
MTDPQPSGGAIGGAPAWLRYALVGGAATAAHYALLAVAVEAWAWRPALAAGTGAVLGAQVAFVGNRRFTFGHRGPWLGAWWRFQLTAVLGAVVSMAVVGGGTRLGLHYLLAQVIATLLAMGITFGVNRRWSFAEAAPNKD